MPKGKILGLRRLKHYTPKESIGELIFGRDFILEEKDQGVNENHGFKRDCILAIVVYHLRHQYPDWLHHHHYHFFR